jgi:hypothetical protein
MNSRIISRQDTKGSNLVKGIHFEGLRMLGKPEHFSFTITSINREGACNFMLPYHHNELSISNKTILMKIGKDL